MNSDLAVKALVTGDVDYAASTASVAKAAALRVSGKDHRKFFQRHGFQSGVETRNQSAERFEK